MEEMRLVKSSYPKGFRESDIYFFWYMIYIGKLIRALNASRRESCFIPEHRLHEISRNQ